MNKEEPPRADKITAVVSKSPDKVFKEKVPRKEKKNDKDEVTDFKVEAEAEQFAGMPKQPKEKKPKKADKQQMVY